MLEDEGSVNRGIIFSLEKAGYIVASCFTIQGAREQAEQFKPEVVICDMNLPDGSGLDYIKWLRASGKAYIICLTALDQGLDQVISLTKNEWKLLNFFLLHPRQILSKQKILAHVFDIEGAYMDYQQGVENGSVYFGWGYFLEDDGFAINQSLTMMLNNGRDSYTFNGKLASAFGGADTYWVMPEGTYENSDYLVNRWGIFG